MQGEVKGNPSRTGGSGFCAQLSRFCAAAVTWGFFFFLGKRSIYMSGTSPPCCFGASCTPACFIAAFLSTQGLPWGDPSAAAPALVLLCSKECRGCLEPSPCPISSSELGCPAKTNIGSKLLNFPGPSTHRAAPVLSQCWAGAGLGVQICPPALCAAHPRSQLGWLGVQEEKNQPQTFLPTLPVLYGALQG